MKWSSFLRSYLTGAYEVVSREKIRIVLDEAYIRVELPKK